MDINELNSASTDCRECNRLQSENQTLKQEIFHLKKLLLDFGYTLTDDYDHHEENKTTGIETESIRPAEDNTLSIELTAHTPVIYQLNEKSRSEDVVGPKKVTKASTIEEKIMLFRSLFKGRDDVFAKRWESTKNGKSGYSPSCLNQWSPGICRKPRIKCSECTQQNYQRYTDDAVMAHMRGKSVIGLYPLLEDNSCWFLAMDFDEGEWRSDIGAIRQFCDEHEIPCAVEVSRSGNGAHVWFFFCENIQASRARAFGSVLLTAVMSKRHELSFSSYDRLFPNQDLLPKGGFGNLIALPLQGQAARNGYSCFVDREWQVYSDQCAFLGQLHRISYGDLERYLTELAVTEHLGELCSISDEEERKPWIKHPTTSLEQIDFPSVLRLTISDGLYIPQIGLSERAMNRIKRLAAFSNPEFYKKQSMRYSTWGTPRIIDCHQEVDGYSRLPRGCYDELLMITSDLGVKTELNDEREHGNAIDVVFKGVLRENQSIAAEALLQKGGGILCGTTAFGKTVTALFLIAQHRVNTLILVGSVPLMQQWKEKVDQFLDIREELIPQEKARGRKKIRHIVGQLGGSRKEINNVIDIAVFQSVVTGDQVSDIVSKYGLVIVDECHHVAAVSFERVMNAVRARHVYGLSATPVRQDGKHPIVFMQCGPIRYRDNAKQQAEERNIPHLLMPRFTSYRIPSDWGNGIDRIQDIFTDLSLSEARNRQIVRDVCEAAESGRKILVLTDRKEHVECLAYEMRKSLSYVVTLTGSGTNKAKKVKLDSVSHSAAGDPLIIVATGKYIGEGFDAPFLDTLFLVMPFSWKGTLAQYAGRLHRMCDGKESVQIYDYVDMRVSVLERMYGKRLKGYRELGYRIGVPGIPPCSTDFIYDADDYWGKLEEDLMNAKHMIWISSMTYVSAKIIQVDHIFNTMNCDKLDLKVFLDRTENPKLQQVRMNEMVRKRMEVNGFTVTDVSQIQPNTILIDDRVMWYGSLAPFGFSKETDNIMRVESPVLVAEMKSILTGPK